MIDKVMKVLVLILEALIRLRAGINEVQFCFMPGRGTTAVMFNRSQIQEKCLAANKLLYFLFLLQVPRVELW